MNNSDKFAKYRPKDSITTNEMPKPSSSEEGFDKFEKYRPQADTATDVAKRIAVQTVTRPLEAVGSIPGNLLRFLSDYSTTAAEKLTGLDLSNFRESLEDTAAFKLLPSSEQGRKGFSALTGGLSDPQTEAEKDYGDVLDTFTLLATAAVNPQSWQALARALGISVLSKGAGKGAQALGFGETGQKVTEGGTTLVTSMFSPGGMAKFLSSQIDKLKSNPVAKHIVPTAGLENKLKTIRAKWNYGTPKPAARQATPKLDALEDLAKKGQAEMGELLESYRSVGSEIQAKELYEKLDTTGRKALRHHFDELKGAIAETIESSTPKPYSKQFQDINQGYMTFAKSRQISDWVMDNKKEIIKTLGPSILADLYLSVGAIGPAAAAAATGFTVKEIGETLYRISKSPTLRKYYAESLRNIAQENTPAALKNMEKLKEAMENEHKNRR